MTLIERIADRLGFIRPEPMMTEIIVFSSREAAREAGFRGWQHPDAPHISAYWPGANMQALAARPFRRVTISERMLRHKTEEGYLVAILRARQAVFGPDAVWIVL